jgi:hypothetical protein
MLMLNSWPPPGAVEIAADMAAVCEGRAPLPATEEEKTGTVVALKPMLVNNLFRFYTDTCVTLPNTKNY